MDPSDHAYRCLAIAFSQLLEESVVSGEGQVDFALCGAGAVRGDAFFELCKIAV